MNDELPPPPRSFWQRYGTILIIVSLLAILTLVGLGLLIGFGVATFERAREDAEQKVASAKCMELEFALQEAEELGRIGKDPENAMEQLIAIGRVRPDKLRDPWGQAFVVTRRDGRYRVHSKGPDRKNGTDDDIKTGS